MRVGRRQAQRVRHRALRAAAPEGGDGLPDDQLIQIGRDVGLSDTFAQCVTGGTYLTWVPKVTAAASERGLRGTPTAFVNDKQIESTVEALTAAVNGAVG
ncbi:DsbA family protein [Luedemannella flava]